MNVLFALVQLLVGALIYGGAALVGSLLATGLLPHLKRFDDGPEPVAVNPLALIAGSAAIGAFIAWHHPPILELLIGAVAAVALVGVWYCDARTGIMPDAFTLAPLAVAFLYGVLTHQWQAMLISSALVFVPFALAALFSKGRGMGWGDAKLAAFAGALLGPMTGLLALGVASLAAVVVTSIRHRSKPVPIAFAPYLVCGIAFGIVFNAYKSW